MRIHYLRLGQTHTCECGDLLGVWNARSEVGVVVCAVCGRESAIAPTQDQTPIWLSEQLSLEDIIGSRGKFNDTPADYVVQRI